MMQNLGLDISNIKSLWTALTSLTENVLLPFSGGLEDEGKPLNQAYGINGLILKSAYYGVLYCNNDFAVKVRSNDRMTYISISRNFLADIEELGCEVEPWQSLLYALYTEVPGDIESNVWYYWEERQFTLTFPNWASWWKVLWSL